METCQIELGGQEIYPNIYKGIELLPRNNRKLVAIVIGVSGAGKDRIVEEMKQKNLFRHVLTATTRLRRFKALKEEDNEKLLSIANSALTREDHNKILNEFAQRGLATVEPENAYVWMRFMRPSDETQEQYFENLRKEYTLIENHVHDGGNLYGLPKNSLIAHDDSMSIPVLRIEVNGAITLNNLLPQDEFQIVNLTIVPDSLDQSKDDMIARATNLSQSELEDRMRKNIEDCQMYKDITNFYIKNTRQEINGRPGIETTIDSLSKLTLDLLQSE